jgi:Animal haem peroxidase
MRILRVPRAPKLSPAEDRLPPTYINTETHWWDASQLYGSNAEFQQKIRLGGDGKVRLNRHNGVKTRKC